jgi:hypothetical protein
VCPGQKLVIPEGTFHSVIIGSKGATYIMGLREPIPQDDFQVYLPENRPELMELLEINYEISDMENLGDAGREFFERVLSDDLMFVRATGQCVDKSVFILGLQKGGDRKSRHVDLRTWQVSDGVSSLQASWIWVEIPT